MFYKNFIKHKHFIFFFKFFVSLSDLGHKSHWSDKHIKITFNNKYYTNNLEQERNMG